MRIFPSLIVIALAACDGGANAIDAKIFMDAPPAMISLWGTARQVTTTGSSAEPGVVLEAYQNTDESTPIAMAMTDASGEYSLPIVTNGIAFEGYVKATKVGLKTTYFYLPPLGTDFEMPSITLVTQGTYDLFSTVGQGNQTPGNGLIALVVVDEDGPVIYASVSSTPPLAPYRYNRNNFPDATATQTDGDGIAYMFNAPAVQITVAAEKHAFEFQSHGLKAWPDQLTMTLIVRCKPIHPGNGVARSAHDDARRPVNDRGARTVVPAIQMCDPT